MSKKHLRKKFFVDRSVQGALLLRAARYWALSVAVIGMLTVFGWVFFTPNVLESPEKIGPLVLVLAIAVTIASLLLPVALYDLVRFTHRFAGPMVRLRESMRRAAAGESVEPLRFRDGDFWQEFAEAFNAMQARMNAGSGGDVSPPEKRDGAARQSALINSDADQAVSVTP